MNDVNGAANSKTLSRPKPQKSSGSSWLKDNPTLAKVGLLAVLVLVIVVILVVNLGGGGKEVGRSAPPPQQNYQAPPPPAVQSGPQPPGPAPPGEDPTVEEEEEEDAQQPEETPEAPTAPQPEDDGLRPEVVTDWKRNHYFSARAENDPRLVEAIEHFGKRFVGNAAAARMLANLLAPLEEEVEETQGGIPQWVVRNPYQQSGSQLIPAVVEALGANGTEDARATLEGLLAGTLPSDDDQAAVDAALKTLVDHPSPENEAILFRTLTSAEQLRPPIEGKLSAQELREKTLALIRSDSSERFRIQLAKYVFQPTTPREPRETLLEFLQGNDPNNLGAQLFLYQLEATDEETKTTLEGYFTDYSSQVMTHLLDLSTDGEQTTTAGIYASSTRRPPPIRTWGGPVEEAEQTDPNLPYRLAQRLWGPECVALLDDRLREIDTLQEQTQLVVLAGTIPVESLRSTLRRSLQRHWEDGAKELETAGWSTDVVGDPGLLLVLKALPRREPKDVDASSGVSSRRTTSRRTTSRRPRDGSSRSGTLSDEAKKREEAGQDWMTASENLVRAWCQRFHATSLVRAEADRLAGQAPSYDQVAANLPISLHADAQIAAGYQVDWPSDLTAKLSGTTPGPMAVRYVRIEEKARLINRQGYYRRQLRLKKERTVDDGVWLDSYRVIPQTDRKRSVDVLITRVETDTTRSEDEEPVEDEDLIIEILSIEMKDPAPREK